MMITIKSKRRPMVAAVALWIFVFDAAVPAFFTANAFVARPATVARYHQNQQEQSRPSEIPLFMAEEEKSDGWVAPKSAMIGGAGVNNAGEPPFEIRGFSLGNLVIGTGFLVTFLSFQEYLGYSGLDNGLKVSGLGFVYGIPIMLAGAALKYAEIDPVPCITNPSGEQAFEQYATETIRKIKQDVTRHRYGDEAHLDTAVKKLGLVIPGKDYPQMTEIRQDAVKSQADGSDQIAFTMVWQSRDTPYRMWADDRRVQKYETFFGPGVNAQVIKIDSEQRLVGIQLTTGPKPAPAPAQTEETAAVLTNEE